MGKRARRHYSSVCKKQKRGNDSEDIITELPDEVLVFILSMLTVEEAVRTSVLSKRWRDKWMHISSLDFEASHVFKSSELLQSSFEKERPKYVRWVNHVLRSCRAPTIDVFKVEFKFDKIYGHIIDHWINFAFRKKVRRLEMNLSPYMQFPKPFFIVPDVNKSPKKVRRLEMNLSPYVQIPNPFFIVPDVNKSPKYFLSKSLGFSPCDSLTILRLKYINVSGEVLEYFLSNCLFLEELCVVNSDSLVNLKVSGPYVQLKYLEICDCFYIKNLEISANSLVSFKYSGPKTNLLLKDAPQLSEILIGGRYCQFLLNDCCHLSSYFCQIETLILGLYGVKKYMDLVQFPILSNLKHLELNALASDDESLLCFCPLIEASPFLNKFVLELVWFKSSGGRKRKKVMPTKKFSHQSLKVVELLGFVGRTIDVEFAFYFILNADMLEKITFDSRDPRKIKRPWEIVEETKEKSEARKSAQRLGAKLPPDVDVIVI